LAKRQAEAAKAKHRAEPEETAVEFGLCVELVDECELAITPGSDFRKDAFDKRPRLLKLLIRELLG
ncbi:MAG TPA: hypothetical protein VNA65_11115, partial [Candidatus Dormibacteraeota bacterium]|nr:hypothetical protein [Candidatus Dormibacteraeota bacterium]